MIDERNDWDKICGRLKEKGEDKLWDYITALRSMDTRKGHIGGQYLKIMMTDPLRGVHYRVDDIRATYEELEHLRSWNDVFNLIYGLIEDVDNIEYHYTSHTVMGWRAIGEEDIAEHLEEIHGLIWDDKIWCFELICKINKFVRKICVKGELIGDDMENKIF